jgi:hypothetical protein
MRGRARTAKRSQPRFFFTRERSESDGSVEPLFAEAGSRETQPYRAIGMPEGDRVLDHESRKAYSDACSLTGSLMNC